MVYICYSQNLSIKLKSLIGMFECRVDTKGRFLLPSGLKKQLTTELQEGFVLKRSVFNSCLELHTLTEWRGVMGQVNTLNRFVKKNNDFIRLFTSGVRSVEPDVNARIQIPKDLINYANIDKKIVLASVGNSIEIWDKEKYESAVNDASLDFAQLAEEVMGDKPKNKEDE